MGLVIKESIKSTVTTFSGALLGLLTMIFSVKIFSLEEYGFYQSILKICAILGYFFILGFDYTLLIIGQRYPDDDKKRGAFLRYCLIVPLAIFFLLLIPFLLLKDVIISQIDADDTHYYERYFYYFPIITFIFIIIYWFSGYLRSKNKSTSAYFLHDVVLRIANLLVIFLFAMDVLSFEGFVLGLMLSLLLPAVWSILLSRKQKGFTLSVQETLDKSEKRHIVEFAFFHMMVVVSSMLIFHIDSFIFPYIVEDSLKKIGVFSLSLYVISVLRMPLRVVGLNAIPTLTQYYDQKNHIKLKELFGRSSLNLQLLGSLMCVLVIINVSDIQTILDTWKAGYGYFEEILPILIIGVWIELCLGLNFEMMGISKYYRYTFWMSCLYLILSVSLFVYLGNEWDIKGAAWAFSISLILFSISKSVFVHKKIGLQPFDKDAYKIAILTFFCLFFYFFPCVIHPFVSIFVRSIVVILTFSFVSIKWKIGEDVGHLYFKLRNRLKGQ